VSTRQFCRIPLEELIDLQQLRQSMDSIINVGSGNVRVLYGNKLAKGLGRFLNPDFRHLSASYSLVDGCTADFIDKDIE
jgi:phage baseplate assembly protein W